MTEMEQFIDEAIENVARRAFRRSSGGIEKSDIIGSLWEKVLQLRDHPDKWNKDYLSVVIWKNAFGSHHRKVEPIPIVEEGEDAISEQPPTCYLDLREMIAAIPKDDTRAVAEMYCDGLSIESIASSMDITCDRVNVILGNAKRQLRTAISNLDESEQAAMLNSR